MAELKTIISSNSDPTDPLRGRRIHYNIIMTGRFSVSSTLLILSIAAAAAFGVGVLVARTSPSPSGVADIPGFLWPDPPAVSPFELVRDTGEPFNERDLAGKWSFMFFGFTHCPDVCPTTMSTLNTVAQTLAADPDFGDRGQVVFVSVDPARDTPEVLRSYVDFFNDSFVGVTAAADESLRAFTRQLGIYYQRVDLASAADYTMDHTASILLFDPRARLVAVFSMPHDADDIARRFIAIAAALDS
jgi:protein SCO1/2